MDSEQRSEFHNIVESVGESYQNHPLDLVNEHMVHPRLVEKLRCELTLEKVDADLNIEWKDWSSKWKKNLWKEIEDQGFGKVSPLRSEVRFPDTLDNDVENNYFDIVLFDDEQEEVEFLSKSKGPANWFSKENDIEVLAEVKHSKTSDEKDFFREEKGASDIEALSKFPGTDIERVFIFANHYPINHYKSQNRSDQWWKELEQKLNGEELSSPVVVYYIPQEYSTGFDQSIQDVNHSIEKKVVRGTNGGVELEPLH